MFILKGLLILFLFVFILGFVATFWLKYKFRQIQRNFRKRQGMENEEQTVYQERKPKAKKPNNNLKDKGEYVDFEEIDK